jgi:Na+-transporting methylmalonyl-CoA/oxaloacetate decarboxylase gamma subunit
MPWLLLVISFLCVLAAATIATSEMVPEATTAPPEPEAKAAKESKSPSPASGGPGASHATEIRKLADEQYKQCVADWDAATHITKKEWRRVCRRTADQRAKFRVEEMGK